MVTIKTIKQVRILIEALRKVGVPRTALTSVSTWADNQEKKLQEQGG